MNLLVQGKNAGMRLPLRMLLFLTFEKAESHCFIRKFLFAMKLTIVLLLISTFSVFAKGFSQITLELKNATLEQAFEQIEAQTGYSFLFQYKAIKDVKNITVSAKNISLETALELCFRDQPVNYKIVDKSIVIEKPAAGLSTRLDNPRPVFTSDTPPITVRGRILNENGEPVIASVLIKGTKRGTTSDANGYFELNKVDANAELIVSATNIETVIVKVKDNYGLSIVVVVHMISSSLSEVVVNKGYYSEKQKLSTGSVVKITSKEITGQPVTSPLLALQGRVPGLELSPINGAPGAAPLVRIRGNNSLRFAGGYPLYVIDGVMIDSRPLESQSDLYFRGLDPLAGINPENIESIEVLKDADATSIYGSKGANGVILIKTKVRKDGKSTGIEISAYYGMGEMPRFVDLLNTSQYVEMRKEAFSNANATPSAFDFDLTYWDSTKNTNWQKELLGGSSKVSDVELAFSGGNSQTSFRLTGGYHKETTFISDNFGFERGTAGLSINHRSADNRFVIAATANYGITKNKNLNLPSFIQSALNTPPNAPDLYHEDGSLNWEIVHFPAFNFSLASFQNPMAELLRTNESTVGTLVSNATLSYQLIKGLSIKTGLGYTNVSGDELIKNPILAVPPTLIGGGTTASAFFGINNRRSWMIEPQIAYDFTRGGHAFNILVGSTLQQNTTQWQAVRATGYTSDVLLNSLRGATNYNYIADNRIEYRYNAVFARVGYNWREKYLINLTGRRDGSSRFGPGKQYGNFGAIGAGWIFSSEDFMSEASNIVSFGKLRGSFGTTGNDQIEDYKFYNLYTIGDYGYQNLPILVPKGLFNRDFNWEVTKKLEVALELNFLKDRISVQASWYRNRSSNQVIDYQLPATTGFPSISKNFDATVQNTGWEFSLISRIINSKDFNWTTSMNLTIPKNQLVAFPGIEESPYSNIYKIGEPLNIQNLHVWEGIDPQTGSHILADLDNNGVFDEKDRVFTSPLGPKYYGGIMNTLRLKGIELAFLFQFSKQLGNSQYNSYPGLTRENQPVEVMNRWRKEGDVTTIAKFSTDFSLANFYSVNVLNSNHNIVDASFLRLKTVSLSYLFPKSIFDKLKMEQARIFIQGQNLYVISNFSGLDPETGARTMPQLRTVTAGINVKF